MRNVKGIDTRKLMVYSELISKIVSDLDAIGMQATYAARDGQITDQNKDKIQSSLLAKINIYEPIRIELVTEVNKRFKKDLNVSQGPSELDEFVIGIRKEYPDMFLTKAEYDFKQSQKDPNPKGKTIKLKS